MQSFTTFLLSSSAYPPLSTSIDAPDTGDRDGSGGSKVDIQKDEPNWPWQQPDQPGDGNDGGAKGETTPGKGGNPGSTVPLYRDDKDTRKKLPFGKCRPMRRICRILYFPSQKVPLCKNILLVIPMLVKLRVSFEACTLNT